MANIFLLEGKGLGKGRCTLSPLGGQLLNMTTKLHFMILTKDDDWFIDYRFIMQLFCILRNKNFVNTIFGIFTF